MKEMYYYLIPMVILGIVFVVYLKYSKKEKKLEKENIPPRISVAFIVKDNEKLFYQALVTLLALKDNIHQILVLDLGSIDKTLEVAHHLLEKDHRAKIIDISKKTITKSHFEILREQVTEPTLFLIDLYRISLKNPDVYVPHLFRPIEIINKGLPKGDPRIDGIKLLYFDEMERKKNNYILREYVVETLSNIRMHFELLAKDTKEHPKNIDKNTEDMLSYMDTSTKNMSRLSRLIGTIKFSDATLQDNLLSIFNHYSRSNNITVNYQVSGSVKNLRHPVNHVILTIVQDLLHTIVHYNLCTKIEVTGSYGRNKLKLLFKYKNSKNDKVLLEKDNGLSYYVLCSIQNRLSLVGGKIRLKTKGKDTTILIQLPLSSHLNKNKVGIKNEK